MDMRTILEMVWCFIHNLESTVPAGTLEPRIVWRLAKRFEMECSRDDRNLDLDEFTDKYSKSWGIDLNMSVEKYNEITGITSDPRYKRRDIRL